jgi:hypothetical protein
VLSNFLLGAVQAEAAGKSDVVQQLQLLCSRDPDLMQV